MTLSLRDQFARQTRATAGVICWSWGAFKGAADPGVTLMWQIIVLEYFLATALHQSFAKPVLSTTRGVSNASPLPVDSYLLCWVNMHCTIRWLDTRYEVHLGAELAREWRWWLPEWSTTSLGHRSELHIMYKESELANCFYFWNKLNQHLCWAAMQPVHYQKIHLWCNKYM